MNILIINWQCWTNPLSGGAEAHLHEIFKRIAKAGNNVTLFCSKYKGSPNEEIIDGIKIIRRGGRNTFNFIVPFYYFFLFKKQYYSVVIDDINKIPFFTPLYVKQNLTCIVHHYFDKSIFLESGKILGNYVFRTENLIGRIYKNTPMFVVSKSTKDESIKRGIKEENIFFAPNGIDVKKFREKLIEKTSFPSIGYFGRLKKYKSVQHLISAFIEVKKNIPDLKLVIIGKGDFENELKKQSELSGYNEDIIFTGYVSEEMKVEWLNKLWLVVNPSMKEGWGIANVEANACGTPVIVANSPGLRDSVIDNYNGLLYDYGDIKKLSDLIIEVIKNNDLRSKLALGSKEFTDNLSWDNSAQSVLNTLNQIIKQKKIINE